MQACITPQSADDGCMPISLKKREAAAVVKLRDFMRAGTTSARRHASLRAPDGRELEIPPSIYRVLAAAVSAMADGHAVSIVPVHHELTTRQAADLLNVSRPHLVKLLDAGDIPHHRTGSHRRVYVEDLMRYRRLRDTERRAALAELSRKSAEYGLDF